MSRKVRLSIVVGLVAIALLVNSGLADNCLKGSGCSGGCSWYQVCMMAPTSIAVLSNCPDPDGYEPGTDICGRCFGLTGWGDFCGAGMAIAACIGGVAY